MAAVVTYVVRQTSVMVVNDRNGEVIYTNRVKLPVYIWLINTAVLLVPILNFLYLISIFWFVTFSSFYDKSYFVLTYPDCPLMDYYHSIKLKVGGDDSWFDKVVKFLTKKV